jgi:hypothetical protein
LSVLENTRLVIFAPASAVNCTDWLKLWSPFVTGKPRLAAVNTWLEPVLLTVSELNMSGDPHRKLM